jgi:hypothetical protein
MRGVERCVRVCLGEGLHKGVGKGGELVQRYLQMRVGNRKFLQNCSTSAWHLLSVTEMAPVLARLLLCFLFPSIRVMPYLCPPSSA